MGREFVINLESVMGGLPTLDTNPLFHSSISHKDINDHLMAHCDSTSIQPVDILVRTSGVKTTERFPSLAGTPDRWASNSGPKPDWQCCEGTQIHFVSVHWPAFGLWDVVGVVQDYQRKEMRMQKYSISLLSNQ